MVSKKGIECELMDVYVILGKKWTIPLLHNITDEPISFNELKKISNNLISPILLSTRLKELVKFNIIQRKIIKGKVIYVLTEEGKGLKRLMHKLKKWAITSKYKLPKDCNVKQCYCDRVFHK